jgi:DNA-directed RNA polymerase specialized sigma24 family protein
VDPYQFEKIVADVYEDAVACVRTVMYLPQDKAEEAVQDATVYCLERLDRFEEITPSYFKQLCINRAKDFQKKQSRQYRAVLPIGDSGDVVRGEQVAEARRRGRKLPKKSLSKQEGDPDDDE